MKTRLFALALVLILALGCVACSAPAQAPEDAADPAAQSPEAPAAETDSAIADLCNTPTNNAAISASAAWLLHHFCPPTIPWAHLDISGTALWRENGRSVASGRPIPLLVEHLLGDL